MSFNKKFFTTGGIVASSGAAVCTTDSTDPFGDSSGVALYNLDYDASTAPDGTDYSGTPSNVTFGVGGQINYGARFNGSSSYIDTNLQMPSTTTFTFSAWVNTAGSVNQHIVGDFTTSATGATFRVQIALDNNISVGVGNGTNINYNSFGIISGLANTWKHIAVTVDGTSVKAYVDGSQHGSTWTSSYSLAAGSNDFVIGAYALGSGYQNFDGDIDQVRIFNTALTDNQISTLNAETACVYTATTDRNDYPVANTMYHKFDNSAEDEVGTATSTEQEMQYRFGRYGQAGLFNGLNNGSEINTNYTTADTALTHSIWINQSGLGHDGFNVVLGRYWDGNTPMHLGYYIWTNASTINWWVFYGGTTSNTSSRIETSGTISQNQWHHIVATWTDGTGAKLYIDGDLAQSTSSTQTRNKNGITLDLGSFGGSRTNQANFKGLLDTHRYFNSELSYDQVTELYNEKPETDTSNFKTVLYEGTGANQFISNVGMDLETNGGLVWIKNRSSSSNYFHALIDLVRGTGQVLSSNASTLDTTNYTDQLTSFEANGFFVGNNSSGGNYMNLSGDDYVGWVFKGGGEAVNIAVNSITGSTPSIASDVSANPAAGFSIVKYTPPSGGSVYTNTVGHGLSSAPEIIIQKATGITAAWYVHTSLIDGSNDYLVLNSTAAKVDNIHNFAVTSTTFTDWGWNGNEIINYCFHSVSGYSKIGTYTGNGTTSKTVSDPSFEPSFVMIKRTDDTSNWRIYDNRRGTNVELYANSSSQDVSATGYINFNSNGFEITTTGGWLNQLNGTYLYMAFK